MPMKTIEGYSKEKYTDTSVLLAGGGAKALSGFIGSLSWDSTNKKIKYTPVGGNETDLVTFGSNAFNSTNFLPLSGGEIKGQLAVIGQNTGASTISGDLDALVIANKQTRATTAGYYYPGIAFNHMWNWDSNKTYQKSPQAWIGLKLHSTPGSELSYLVFATKSDTGAADRPIERMSIAPNGNVIITCGYPELTLYNNTTSGEASMYIKNNTAGWALGVNPWGIGAGMFAIGQYSGTGSSSWRFKIDNNGYCYTSSYLNLGAGNEKNASNPPYVWGVNGSDNYLRTYATSSLSVGYATSAGSIPNVKTFTFNAGKEYIGWVSIAKLKLNDSNQYDYHSFDLYICRNYNSPSSESYACNITIGWCRAQIRLINKSVGTQIINKVRISIDSTNHYLYLLVYVNINYTTYRNGCSATLSGIFNNSWENDNTVNNSVSEVAVYDLTAGTYSDSASNAATSTRASYLSGWDLNPDNSHPGHGARVFFSWNKGQANNASSGYSNGITIGSHPDDTAYGFQIVQNMWDDRTYTRRYNGGWQSWKTLAWTSDIPTKVSQLTNDSGYLTSLPSHSHDYLPLSGGTMTGALTVKQYIFGYNYNHAGGNAPAFVFDKPGSYYTGIGANGEADTIYFSAATISNGEASWVTSYKQKWKFNGTIYQENNTIIHSGNIGSQHVSYADSAGSAPASDVYDWAKQSTKPSYSFSEITPGVATIGDGANRLMFRTHESYRSGIYYSTSGNESMVFANKNSVTSWIFATTDPNANTGWTALTPSLQIKNGRVTINKLIANDTNAAYNLDVNGSANATTLYENGVRVSVSGHTHSYLPLSGGWMDTDAQIYFKGAGSSTSVYGTLGFRSTTPNGFTMHYTNAQSKALYLCVNGYDSATDNGGLAIDNDCVTVFGAGDTGSVFRVIDEDIYNNGPIFLVNTRPNESSNGNVTIRHDGYVSASGGFIKSGSSDSYILLGGGGHKAVSDFVQTSGDQSISGTKTFSGTIKVNRAESTTGFFLTSDFRKKNILGNINEYKAYDFVKNCKPIIYELKDDETHDKQLGLIAQEVEEYFPELVITDENGFKSMDYSRLSVVLFALLKDLMKRNKL